jgi:hypothetical protein
MLVSAEIRWFWKGDCPDQVSQWFENRDFPPGGGKPRRDDYAHLNGNPELGIKKRDKKAGLEVKGLIATLPAPFAALQYPVQLWCKWSADFRTKAPIVVHKTRHLRKFEFNRGTITQLELNAEEKRRDGGRLPDIGCNLEKTEITIEGRNETWYSIGFEAFGDMQTAVSALAATINHLRPLPRFDGHLASYPEWLANFGTD